MADSVYPSTLATQILTDMDSMSIQNHFLTSASSTVQSSILNDNGMNVSETATSVVYSLSKSSESSWLIIRLIDSFSLAVLQQSGESGINGNINDNTNTFLSYWMSPFSMMCMITAVIMNRIIIFASARRNKKLPFISNILLRTFAIYILFQGSYGLFVSLKSYCKFPILQYFLKSNYFTFNKDLFINKTFLSIPFGTSFFEIKNDENSIIEFIGPTTSILKCFHLSLCISQILDTFIAVASGSKPSLETGITLFEYSLAFQEAQFATKPSIELLIIALIALSNQLNIHILGLFNLTKYKLVSSSIIGLFTLSFYSYNLFTANMLQIPFIIILGYFPHFCVLILILLSELIFLLSGIFRFSFNDLTMMSLFENWNSINISLSDDFYTALINFGEFIINVSISQCYIHETSNINLPLDNYINLQLNGMKNNEKLLKKINGYGNEFKNNPELIENNSQIGNDNNNNNNNTINNINNIKYKQNKRKRSWIFVNRLKMLNRMIWKFLKLINLKIKGIFFKKQTISINANSQTISSNINNANIKDKSIKTYRIVSNDQGGFFYESDQIKTTDIDTLNNDEIESSYSKLLLDTILLDNDNSPDFEDIENYYDDNYDDEDNNDDDDDDDDDEYDDDEHQIDFIEEINLSHDTTEKKIEATTIALNELVTLQDLKKLLIPSTAADIKTNQILSYHMQHLDDNVSHLTRSHFNNYYVDDLKLLDLLREKSQNRQVESSDHLKDYNYSYMSDHDHDIENDDLGICVICHENSRQIILWPCKCLAICENCRISLFVREFATCVCCRHSVEGYSKVYIP